MHLGRELQNDLLVSNPVGHPLVLVVWRDSATRGSMRWADLSDALKSDDEFKIASVGWLIKETRTQLVLAPHYSPDAIGGRPQITGEMGIPKGAVVSRRILMKRGRPRG